MATGVDRRYVATAEEQTWGYTSDELVHTADQPTTRLRSTGSGPVFSGGAFAQTTDGSVRSPHRLGSSAQRTRSASAKASCTVHDGRGHCPSAHS
jgi:hypothetical protein